MGIRKAVSDLLGLARAKDATSSELRTALEAARADSEAASAAHVAIEAEYQLALLDPDPAVTDRADAQRTAARRAADRAAALVEALEKRLAEAETSEAEAGRRQRYEEAKAAADKAAALLRKEYSKHAVAIRGIVVELAKADQAVKAANADLPAGADPLAAPEASVRERPAEEREVLKCETVLAWCHADSWDRIPAEREVEVRSRDGVVGTLPAPQGAHSAGAFKVERRKFERVEYRPAEQHVWATPLFRAVKLPGLAPGDAPIWEGDLRFSDDVPAHAADLEARAAHATAQRDGARPIEVEWRPVRDEA